MSTMLAATPLHQWTGFRSVQQTRPTAFARAAPGVSRPSALTRRLKVRMTAGDDQPKETGEDVVARLAAAEEEAAELRKMLEAAQMLNKSNDDDGPQVPAAKRFDGTGYRETMWDVKKGTGETVKPGTDWLQEKDLEAMLSKDGPSEVGASMAMTDEEKATVNKRLLIGLGLTAAFCAAALVPDKQTRSKPSKPCFFYLVPLLRIKALLPELEATVASADTAKLRSGVAIVLGSPNNAKDNLTKAALYLDNDREYDRATTIAVEFVEYMSSVDYSKYFDSVTTKVDERQIAFSTNSVQAAQRKLNEFLALMDPEQLAAAQSQVAAF